VLFAMQIDADVMVARADMIKRVKRPVIIDHLGPGVDPAQVFRTIGGLQGAGRLDQQPQCLRQDSRHQPVHRG